MFNKKTALKQLKSLEKYDNKMRLAAEEWDKPWKTLIATVLSARTRDEVTIRICKRLFSRYKNVKSLANSSLREVQTIIKPINFYKNKSKSILNCAKQLLNNYNGKPPEKFELLMELSGVGRKTANVFLSESGRDAIGVDTHCSYIAQNLGWSKSNKPENIERDLKQLFPRNYWKRINPILVRFGKTYISKRKKNDILDRIKSSLN
jgi:endonuclease-3